MMGFGEQLKKHAKTHGEITIEGMKKFSDCLEGEDKDGNPILNVTKWEKEKSESWVRVKDAVKVAKEHCVSKVELEKLLKNRPDCALIGWAPNPDVAKEFEDFFEKLEGLLKK